MKNSYFIPISGLWLLTSGFSLAILDTNNNGLSDLWERHFNNGSLFDASFNPQGDSDADGWTNAQEAVAGTNPHYPNPPDGLIRPQIVHVPAVVGQPDENGNPGASTPDAIKVAWPTIPGKQYTLLYSADLSAESWLPVGEPFTGTGNVMEYNFPDLSADRAFWRVSVADIDSDADGLTDAEEHQSGSNPNMRDTDNDGINDLPENLQGTNPTIPRIWAFRENHNADGTVTFTWNSYAAHGDWFRLEDRQADGSWKSIYATSYGSPILPYATGSTSYSLTLNPATDYVP